MPTGLTLIDAITHAVATGNAVAAYVYARMAARVALDGSTFHVTNWHARERQLRREIGMQDVYRAEYA